MIRSYRKSRSSSSEPGSIGDFEVSSSDIRSVVFLPCSPTVVLRVGLVKGSL